MRNHIVVLAPMTLVVSATLAVRVNYTQNMTPADKAGLPGQKAMKEWQDTL